MWRRKKRQASNEEETSEHDEKEPPTEEQLPLELWIRIFECLGVEDEITVMHVCSHWCDIQQARKDKRVEVFLRRHQAHCDARSRV